MVQHPPPGRLFDIGGHRLHIVCRGTGAPAVVFDAALGASSVSWGLVQPDVARMTQACAYDRAGFAWSDGGPLPRTAETIASELRRLLERAGVPPPYVLVGHSFGALVVRLFAARNPTDVAGLVLVDPAHPEEWIAPGEAQRRQIERGVRLCTYGERAARLGVARAVAWLAGAGALGPARALVGLVSRGGLSRADEEILAPVWKLPAEMRRPLSSFWTQEKFYAALGSQIGSVCESAADVQRAGGDWLTEMPVIVIAAGSSSPGRMALHAGLARVSRRGELRVAAESGHWVPLDDPGAVLRAVADVVHAVRGRSGPA